VRLASAFKSFLVIRPPKAIKSPIKQTFGTAKDFFSAY
jgi:hypothetical protein